MPIKVICVCGKKFSVKDELAGKKVKCPACLKVLNLSKATAEKRSSKDRQDFEEPSQADSDIEQTDTLTRISEEWKSAASSSKSSEKSSGWVKWKIVLPIGAAVLAVVLALMFPKLRRLMDADREQVSFKDFADGQRDDTLISQAGSETLLVGTVSVQRAVPWTKPDDLVIDQDFQATPENSYETGYVMFGNGSIRHLYLVKGLNREKFRELFTIRREGGNPFGSLYPPDQEIPSPTYPSTEEHVRQSQARIKHMNSLKAIAVAIHKYHARHQHLPPAVVSGTDGKPWHSWRVLILPFLDQGELEQQYDYNVPWDDPKNEAVLKKMPDVYRDPLFESSDDVYTRYLVTTGPGTAFPTGKHPRLPVTLRSASEYSPRK